MDVLLKYFGDDIAKAPLNSQGTWIYCKTFDVQVWGTRGKKFDNSAECLACHHKAPFLPPNPSRGPCDSATRYDLYSCGTQAYCDQYDVEGDKPVPEMHDSKEACFDFFEDPAARENHLR